MRRAAKCSCIIIVTIDAWHHIKTAILKLCAHAVRGLTHTLIFNITYNTLHSITFRMSGRSFLCGLLFSQTLWHKNYIRLYIPIYMGSHAELRSALNFEAHGTSKRTELRSARNFETHGTSKRTELRNARNFEAHGTSKGTELRKCLQSSYVSYYTWTHTIVHTLLLRLT